MRVNIIFLIIIIFSCVFASCAPPLGYISGSASVDDFWAVPRRQYYDDGNDFIKDEDLWVFASFFGIVEKIDIRQVSITLIKNPDGPLPYQTVTIPTNNGSFRLSNSTVGLGRKLISLLYRGRTADYSIEVNDILGIQNGNNNNDDGNLEGLFKWK